jgi:hypothetical protein
MLNEHIDEAGDVVATLASSPSRASYRFRDEQEV